MILPGFKTSTTTRSLVLEAAVRLVFSDLEATYDLVPLTELALISSGGTPLRNDSSFYGGDIPWAKIGDVTATKKWICSTKECITEEALRNSSAKLFPKGTVLFSMYGSIGKTAITTVPMTTNQAILGLEPKPGINSEYLYYSLINARLALFCDAKGTSQMNINGRMVKSFRVPIPPPEISNSIVQFLSSIEEGADIDKIKYFPPYLLDLRRIVSRIEELAARIEEARELRRRAVDEADAFLKSSLKDLFTFADIDAQPLRQLAVLRGGGTPSKSNPYHWEGDIPWISPKDMKYREITDSLDHISEAATHESPAKLLDPGVVLIVVRGMILAKMVPIAVLKVPGTINQDMKALVPCKDLMPEYLCGALWAFNRGLLELVEKSTHDTRKLETSKLLDFKIPVPSLDQQKDVLIRLNDLQSKLDALKRHQAEIAASLDALLPAVLERAFRGEI